LRYFRISVLAFVLLLCAAAGAGAARSGVQPASSLSNAPRFHPDNLLHRTPAPGAPAIERWADEHGISLENWGISPLAAEHSGDRYRWSRVSGTADQPSTVVKQTWDTASNAWVNSMKKDYTYNGSGQK
jgi:hypothetical protein